MDIFVPRNGTVRVVPIRFARAGGGSAEISESLPPIDNRGHLDPTFASHVGVAVGATVDIAVVRVGIPNDLLLYATASNDAFEVESANPLKSVEMGEVRITGLDGAQESRTGWLQIRANSETGPILARLHVEVFILRRFDITFHRVRLTHGTGAHAVQDAPLAMNIDQVATYARHVWIHYGVDIHWEIIDDTFRVNHQWWVNLPTNSMGEIPRMLNATVDNHTCHVFVVRRINQDAGTEGFTAGRMHLRMFGLRRPGIVISEELAWGRSAGSVGNNLAHEIGHFFGNWHVGIRQPPRVDATSYALRNVMHNFEPALTPDSWAAASGSHGDSWERPRSDQHGHGTDRRGTLVTLKRVPGIDNDDQAHRARALLGTAHGAY